MTIYNDIYDRAIYCRAFDECVFKYLKDQTIKIPTYLSSGQELISSAISHICKIKGSTPLIFAQHRCHDIYLNFGGSPIKLIDELLGLPTGCAKGMGGSASIHAPEINMFGHDGMMGSNVPIGVGACYASRKPTIIFVGDAAGEEDYALASYGWAATKKLPILFVVCDNNLSILTEKKVRRSWNISDVAQSMGLLAADLTEKSLVENIESLGYQIFVEPTLLNVRTNRKYWHAGAGIDGEIDDPLSSFTEKIEALKELIDNKWKNRLEKR